jgi:hypothetical protein
LWWTSICLLGGFWQLCLQLMSVEAAFELEWAGSQDFDSTDCPKPLSLSLCVYLHNECCDNKYLWVCGLRSNFCKLLWGFSSSEILLALILCPEVFSGVVLSKFFWRIRLVCTKSQYQTHPHWFWLHLLLWYLQIVIVEIISVQFHICCTIIKWFLLEFLRFYKNPSFKRRKTMTFFPQVL